MSDWIEKHSITCSQCLELADERNCIPADLYNGNDGGEICLACQELNSSKFKTATVLVTCAVKVLLDPGVDVEEKVEEVISNMNYSLNYISREARITETEIREQELTRITLH